jgi:hypothetical protein
MRLRSIGNIHENKNKKRERLNSKSEKKFWWSFKQSSGANVEDDLKTYNKNS